VKLDAVDAKHQGRAYRRPVRQVKGIPATTPLQARL